MADASGAPRRVSMAYILGFSNKPFKDGGPPAPSQPPPPRQPSAFKKMVTTPGGVIEWAASDGRRGRLTGPGKPRLTPTNLAHVPSGKLSVKAASKKDAAEDNFGGLFGGGIFDDAPAATATKNDTSADDSWTAEQDKKLMDMKTENKTWKEIVEDIGKDHDQCKDRFNKIKPKDWRPNNNKGGGGGGKQKQGKQKGEKSQKDETKKEDKQNGEATDGCWGTFGDDNWATGNGANDSGSKNNSGDDPWGGSGGGGGGWNIDGDDKKEGNGDIGGSNWGMGGGSGDNKDGDGGWAMGGGSGGNGVTEGWDNIATGGADTGTSWNDTKNNHNSGGNTSGEGNNGFNISNGDGWPTAPSVKRSSKKGSKSPSKKAASQAGSKQHSSREPEKPSTTAPTEYELTPDSTFSTNDLRLVARILQQDCQMVWNRVSWRFRDKTGRNLHPDVFEKKITGRIEGKDSERGRK